MWEGSKGAKPRPREALLAAGGTECARMGAGWGKALGRSGNWRWDQKLECGVRSPGGTAVYFDLPCQLLHIPYLGAQSRLHLLLCC